MREEFKKELLRLASLVGTDAKNPEKKLLEFVNTIVKTEIQDDKFFKKLKTDFENLSNEDKLDLKINMKALRIKEIRKLILEVITEDEIGFTFTKKEFKKFIEIMMIKASSKTIEINQLYE